MGAGLRRRGAPGAQLRRAGAVGEHAIRALASSDILDLWERGSGMSSAAQALAILAAAVPERSGPELAAMPLGQRDRALLLIRTALAGPVLTASESCDGCGAAIEISVTAEEIGLGGPADLTPASPQSTEIRGRSVTIRPVTGGDMLAAEAASSAEEAQEVLLSRVLEGHGVIDDEIAAMVESELERLDAAADVQIALVCPGCGATSTRAFDAARAVWIELSSQALRLMREVAELAAAFHWSEQEILAMSTRRRRFYLEEVRA